MHLQVLNQIMYLALHLLKASFLFFSLLQQSRFIYQ